MPQAIKLTVGERRSCVYGNTYEIFPGGNYTRAHDPIRIHMTPGIRFLIKDVDAAIAEADRRLKERV
jgi:hypothetical protein